MALDSPSQQSLFFKEQSESSQQPSKPQKKISNKKSEISADAISVVDITLEQEAVCDAEVYNAEVSNAERASVSNIEISNTQTSLEEKTEDEVISSGKSASIANVDPSKLAPMLRQYVEIKQQYSSYLLLFQVGDFFEVFFEDAVTVADALSIRLTSRDKDQNNPIPMCGVPIHAFENYLPRLLTQGFSCVVVEQVEEASQAKGLVRREITRIVTPGVRLDGEGLDEKRSNYLSAIVPNGMDGAIFVSIEVSTGVLLVREANSRDDIENLLFRYAPKEILLPFKDVEAGILDSSEVFTAALDYAKSMQVKISQRAFKLPHVDEAFLKTLFDSCTIEEEVYAKICSDLLGETLQGGNPVLLRGVIALISYVKEITLRVDLCISAYSYEKLSSGYVIDNATRRNLELSEASFDGDRKYSVLGVLDKTKTAAGSRLLQDWLLSPLSNKMEIDQRLDAIQEILASPERIDEVRQILSEVRDIERLSTRIAGNRATPYDFGLLRASLGVMPRIAGILSKFEGRFFGALHEGLDTLDDISTLLHDSFVEDLPPKLGERDVIKDGYHSELERIRSLRKDSQSLLTNMEIDEKSKSGIQNLKIKHNSVFGYFIEVSKGQLAKVPDRYIRKQTLTNAERYVTEELKLLEQEIFSSKSRLFDLERQLFMDIRGIVAAASLRIQKLARSIAVLDVIFTFAHVSLRNGYVRPEIKEDAHTEIIGGRHPVVELVCGRPNFIPNDASLDASSKGFAVLTGPNMGGKSTYLRQLGIIQVLAQCGCFVPAKKASIGVADRIFTRIGSGDALAKGESTFMVEMKEAANIIRNATERSLVLIDEIGRGTATADGLALATAIAHWLIDTSKCRTVFATHFHELTKLAENFERVFCLSVGIVETRQKIEFTHRIEHKASTKSYGIHVAKLAGIPESLIREASKLLSSMDVTTIPVGDSPLGDAVLNIETDETSLDSNMLSSEHYDLIQEMKLLKPEAMTPLQALELLYEYTSRVR